MSHLYFSTPFCSQIPNIRTVLSTRWSAFFHHGHLSRRNITAEASKGANAPHAGESIVEGQEPLEGSSIDADDERNNSAVSASTAPPLLSSSIPSIDKDIKKVVQRTAATFAPRSSTASKNPAVPGTALYTVFEVQGYASMLVGGALSFNLLFPSNEPDIWRLMGMWSVWMFSIPSLRARDCSKNEKEALNYLFLLIPLLNVIIPFFWKSFALVWSADMLAFFLMYTWKMGWIQRAE